VGRVLAPSHPTLHGTIGRLLSHDVALVDLDGRMRRVLVEDLLPAQPVQIVLF
jgi:hypothetical protein